MKTFIKIIILIILLAVVAIVGLFFPAPVKNQPAELNVKDIKITDNTKPFQISIAYPEVSGQEVFNQKVKAIIDSELADFKTNSLENDAAVKKVDPESYAKYPREYDLNIGNDKGQMDKDILSAVFNIYNFEGGAHGASYFKSVNYSPNKKSDLKLADLFPGQPDYLQKISDFCINDLKTQMIASGAIEMSNDEWLKEGAGPKEENFPNFLANKDSITFYFDQYQVAAGAGGTFKVTMPR